MSKATIYIQGVIGEDTNLLDVVRQFKSYNKPTEVEVIINSPGGFVDVGEAIYNYLTKLNLPVTTVAEKCYSIAAKIFMAGSTRIAANDGIPKIMIHMPWVQGLSGGSDFIESTLNELRAMEAEFIQFYMQAMTIEDESTVRNLLKNETYLTAEEALDLGMVTELYVPLKAVAMLSNNVNNNSQIDKSLMNKFQERLDQILNILSPTIKNEKTVQDATGKALVFSDLNDGDEISVGDKATVDGKIAQGEYLRPDGSTLVFENGAITEIKPADAEETPAEEPAVETAQAKAEETPAEETENVETAEVETTEAETAETTDEVETETTETAEVETEDAIQIKELMEKVKELQAELDEMKELEKMLEVMESLTLQNKELKTEVLNLKKSIGSDFSYDNQTEPTSTVKAQGNNGTRTIKLK